MQKKRWLLFLAGVLPLFCLSSCRMTKLASTVTNDPQAAKKISGLKYYVGKDLLILNVKKATVSAKKVTEALEIKSSENIEYEGKVAVQTVPDMDFPFTLAIKPGSFDASKFKIELYENGIVKSINVESVGEGGEILKNVFRFTGTIASFVSPTSIPFLAASILGPTLAGQAGGTIGAEEKPKDIDEKEKEYEARCLNEIDFSRLDEIDNFKSLARELRLFLQCDQQACDLWTEMHDVEKNINDSFKRKNELLRSLPNVPAGVVRAIKAELDWINSENEKRSVLLSAKDSQFRIVFDAFMEKAGIGKQLKNETFPGQFAIDKIPSIDRLEYMQSKVACLHEGILEFTDIREQISKISKLDYREFYMPETSMIDRCKFATKLQAVSNDFMQNDFTPSCEKCPKICEIHEEIVKSVKIGVKKKLDYWINFIEGLKEFEKIDPLMIKNLSKDIAELQGLVFSEIRKAVQKQIDFQLGDFREAREFFTKSGVLVFISHLTDFGKKLNPQTAKPEVLGSPVVYYRQTIPVQISFYCLDSDGNLSKISDEKIDVLHPQMPIYYFTFSWSAWATRTLGLLFNSKGQPMVFEQTSTSAAKNLTGSLADSLKVARDEYADSLKKITDIQDSQRKIKMDDLSTKIEQMKKEKELIDAQLEKEAVTSNYDLILRQRQLSAELDVLQKEFVLEKTAETGPQEFELAKLKLELEQLKQELEILKIKLELGKK